MSQKKNPQANSPICPIPIDKVFPMMYTDMYREKVLFLREKMYKKVLLTDKEIALLKRVIGDYMNEKLVPEIRNLQHIYSRLRDIKPTEKYVQSIN